MTTALVIVLFCPTDNDIHHIQHVSQQYPGVIVDNSEERHFESQQVNLMNYIFLGQNKGIAHAQNVGIQHILQHIPSDYIVFMDQDSRWEDDYVQKITSEYGSLLEKGIRLSALGPMVYRRETGEEYKSIIHKKTFLNDDFILRKHIISSGCCIRRELFQEAGTFEDMLFIDFVDDEWCWRANAKGYVCGITPHVRISHSIGRKEIHIGKYVIIISAPFRYYYQYRNYLILARRGYVPLQWKISYAIKYFARFFYFPVFVDNGKECWKFMWRGIKDGIKNNSK
jgi:rhamnosyltransferase